MRNGIINVNKPPELTSFRVVSLVRRGTGVRRVGHAGTLDPMATGVLLVCLGQATRISEYLMRLPKTYRATITLGVETDSYDSEGAVVATRPVECSLHAVEAALNRQAGTVSQTPPAHSAVKVGGVRAYEAARKGRDVALKPRLVRIERIALLRYQPPELEIEVVCGKGTYIRSIAHDVGRELGCGGHLSALQRTRVGPFSVETAVALEDLARAMEEGAWPALVQPMDLALMDLPAVTLHIEDEKDIRHGQSVRIDDDRLAGINLHDEPECRAYGEDGRLVALLKYESTTGFWRPRKVFAVEAED